MVYSWHLYWGWIMYLKATICNKITISSFCMIHNHAYPFPSQLSLWTEKYWIAQLRRDHRKGLGVAIGMLLIHSCTKTSLLQIVTVNGMGYDLGMIYIYIYVYLVYKEWDMSKKIEGCQYNECWYSRSLIIRCIHQLVVNL